MSLTLYNTLTRAKAPFTPRDANNVRMYVCGPTVYDFAHIGNARPIIVFDVLFRLLRHVYGDTHVTYARNITDVDDKINARAVERYPDMDPILAIKQLTTETTAQFHQDIAALGVLAPTVEPRATDHIEGMRTLCEALVAKGHAYVAENHILFHVPSMADYGKLSGRSTDDMIAGARVDVAPYKRDPMDFVLWKPSEPGVPAWPSPCGIAVAGRPGWHIECSAMAGKHLGDEFDIHGGGIDLAFPHHENEVAQSRSAHGTAAMADVWMHNGFLQVEGEKMSKSLGNFITINELLATKKFGGQPWHGRVLRLAMLTTHYRQPIDWTVDRLVQARATLMEFADIVHGVAASAEPLPEVVAALSDDLNTPSAMSIIHGVAKSARRNPVSAGDLKATLQFLGLLGNETAADLDLGRATLDIDKSEIARMIAARAEARRARDFKASDRIRDELSAKGIQLKDAKNPVTGEVETTWEVKR
jgi:cysteinyl-tRNA synthetase